ncbi:MaoC family dehydratase [Falsiroseomonas stagni]|uniref:MaoC like domain-containing protein n=1 Tax=Falsiroseomonas stagni DSM 19981 TaxID=1123062 RepID=A0A1I4CBI9_9PROT|nr:MaoC family dehydratase [Falsiroseomonas stagni]SFK78512.1 MaoC like domain-containing protein [Falsiroseomonas stagni DSM 19981]
MELRPGDEIRARPRIMTRERMRWYVDALPTVEANDGRVHFSVPTIHDDDEYAKGQGLPGIISDGMITTNWILDLLLRSFGTQVLEDPGALVTKFIAPVYENVPITCALRVEGVEALPEGGSRLALKVWAEDGAGRIVTVGTAALRVN